MKCVCKICCFISVFSKLKSFIHKWQIHKLESRESQEVWEKDYELIENEGLFEEYLEMGQLSVSLHLSIVRLGYFEFSHDLIHTANKLRNKSVFSFLHRLTTWHCPHAAASRRCAAAAVDRRLCSDRSIHPGRPAHSSKPAASTCDGRMGRRNRRIHRVTVT